MADKITIFKEVFDYYYDGEITKEQFADLLLMHYETRWGNGVDIKEIEDKDLRMIWRTLQHSVIKSTKNAKQYEKQQNKKSALQEVTTTEFDIPNCQIPNTANLSPSNDEEVEQPQPIGDNATESLKTGKEQEIPNEFMEGLTNSTEDEMVEVLMSDEELVEYVANKFIKTEGEDAYDMFIKLNSVNPKSDEFRVLSNRWKFKWERYITTEKRKSLTENITDIVWRRYYQRYRKEIA